jgi:hypothetical protein
MVFESRKIISEDISYYALHRHVTSPRLASVPTIRVLHSSPFSALRVAPRSEQRVNEKSAICNV